jgi:hypothetical protein
MTRDTNRLAEADLRRLGASLEAECREYRRLLRLAWRQNSYMRRQDVDRLEANARDWARHLPAADAVRIARERMVDELARKAGIAIPPGRVGDLLDYAAPDPKAAVRRALGELRTAAARLARQNEMNRTLAEFCLDLSHEETEIFRRTVLDDPRGSYDENARASTRGPGGVVHRQA